MPAALWRPVECRGKAARRMSRRANPGEFGELKSSREGAPGAEIRPDLNVGQIWSTIGQRWRSLVQVGQLVDQIWGRNGRPNAAKICTSLAKVYQTRDNFGQRANSPLPEQLLDNCCATFGQLVSSPSAPGVTLRDVWRVTFPQLAGDFMALP